MPAKRIVASVTMVCMLVCMFGCYSKRLIYRAELEDHREYKISAVVTQEGDYFEFEPSAVFTDSMIVGKLAGGGFKEVPLDQVKMVHIKVVDPATSCLAAIGVTTAAIGLGLLIILATKECCPFVYSYDGEQYIFDGEPYGGAICEAFHRTDLSRLEHLIPIDGEYRIQLVNEVEETQHTDEFKLWIVDHPPEVNVIQDAKNNLYSVGTLQKPLYAISGNEEDEYVWVSESDMLWWESDIRHKTPDNDADLRDTLYLSFLRPPDSDIAKLVVHGCNTLWASQMLMRMVALFGSYVEQFYEKMDDPGLLTQRDDWEKWTEIYALNVDVWVNESWDHRGKIIGGGPFMAEQRIVPLSLEGVVGDTLKIRLAPPSGFWQFNSFAVDYAEPVAFEMKEISAMSMVGHDGDDLCAVLESSDRNYYVMPEVGQRAYLTFPVPELKPGRGRTIFAKVSGYYEMHLNARGMPQMAKIKRILTESDYVVRFALEEYQKWLDEQVTMRNEVR
ncbi:MAG: hypothetical protein JSV53_03885 [candidate division WOR-3 bacterium]|nr:MAG: hypothetical protein JSV53_03885 [candidate division WOR-3 bacterium]